MTHFWSSTSSKNTKQNHSFCKQEKGPFLLITGDYHRLRSYLSFKSHNCDVKLIPKKVNFNMLLFYPSSYYLLKDVYEDDDVKFHSYYYL